jgi:PHD/YefM family antitoxin component YafN of YafNO toxin-antitoxin module
MKRSSRSCVTIVDRRVPTRDGKPRAMVMSPEEFERLTETTRFTVTVIEGAG